MSHLKFGKAPFNMNWKILINNRTEPIKSYYELLEFQNNMMEKVEGSEVTTNRYGIYLFSNNFIQTLHGYTKSLDAKLPLMTVIMERQLNEQQTYLYAILGDIRFHERKGRDKLAAKFRFYAGYILWRELCEYEKVLNSTEFTEVYKSIEKDFVEESTNHKPSDIPSQKFHALKELIGSLKLDYVIHELKQLSDSLGRKPTLLDALYKFDTSITSEIRKRKGIFGEVLYDEHSRIIHSNYQTLSVSKGYVNPGFEQIKSVMDHPLNLLESFNNISDTTSQLFEHFWSQEFE